MTLQRQYIKYKLNTKHSTIQVTTHGWCLRLASAAHQCKAADAKCLHVNLVKSLIHTLTMASKPFVRTSHIYATRKSTDLSFDVYAPLGSTLVNSPRPVLLWLHGGFLVISLCRTPRLPTVLQLTLTHERSLVVESPFQLGCSRPPLPVAGL